MYNCKIKELYNPFKIRKGERVLNIEKYVEILNDNVIYFNPV